MYPGTRLQQSRMLTGQTLSGSSNARIRLIPISADRFRGCSNKGPGSRARQPSVGAEGLFPLATLLVYFT